MKWEIGVRERVKKDGLRGVEMERGIDGEAEDEREKTGGGVWTPMEYEG